MSNSFFKALFLKCIYGVIYGFAIGIGLLPIMIVMDKTNPSQKDFEAFAAQEGFVIPSVSRKDFGVASYYQIKGNFTGEERSYVGVFHTFIRVPDVHRAQP
jgi:hypothetical protein